MPAAPLATPTLKRSESPGRKKPASNPVSAKMIPAMPATPRELESSVRTISSRRSALYSDRTKSRIGCMRFRYRLAGGTEARHDAVDHALIDLQVAARDHAFAKPLLEEGGALLSLLLV